MESKSFDDIRTELLGIEHWARSKQGDYPSRYANAHLQEIVAFMWLAITQVEYARLALEDIPNRGK